MKRLVNLSIQCIKNPCKFIKHWGGKGHYKWMSDKLYLKICYQAAFGKKLNLENPQTFNEKLQWLKLYNHNPQYINMVDKYEVKKHVANIIGEEYIIPTLGIWDGFDDIDFASLPNQFVLKCTHDSGGIVICKNKQKFNKKNARKKLNKALKRNFYYVGREWPYKYVKPRIIAEKYMIDEAEKELKDYKIFNFDGQAKLIQVDYDRFVKHKRNLYSINWDYIDMQLEYPTDPSVKISKPQKLEEMLVLSRMLSDKIPHVRTDFYIVNNKIYFGELTFFHGSGFERFYPEEYDMKLGSWITLPENRKNRE